MNESAGIGLTCGQMQDPTLPVVSMLVVVPMKLLFPPCELCVTVIAGPLQRVPRQAVSFRAVREIAQMPTWPAFMLSAL